MTLDSLAQLLNFASIRRHRDRFHRRQRLLKNQARVHTVTMRGGIVHVPAIEDAEFDTQSYASIRTDRDTIELCKDPVDVANRGQNKLQKALDRAMHQERKETRKMQKLATKAARKRGISGGSNRIALLSVGTESDSSIASDEDILAEIWASRSPSCDGIADDDLPEVEEDLSQSAPMEFVFFSGCPDNINRRELDVGHRRVRPNARPARCPATSSYATTIPTKPTLVSKMPPLFVPRMGSSSLCEDN